MHFEDLRIRIQFLQTIRVAPALAGVAVIVWEDRVNRGLHEVP